MASLKTARHRQATTLTCAGEVFVGGGINGTSTLGSTELYDPALDTWSASGALSNNRYDATATGLPDGQILVSGGIIAASLATVDLVDTVHASTLHGPPLQVARSGHVAVLLADGRVLVVGGVGSLGQPLASAEVFDPASPASWTDAGTMQSPRQAFAAVLLSAPPWAGKVLAIGGFDGKSYLATAELYDPDTAQWTALDGAMGSARGYHVAVERPDGTVLVVGGFNGSFALLDSQVLDPTTGQWSSLAAQLPRRAEDLTLNVLADGSVLAVGGTDQTDPPLAVSETLTSGAPAWADAGVMSIGRYNHASVALLDGRILIIGGVVLPVPSGTTNIVEAFTPAGL